MKIINDIREWKENDAVATIGFFDGVHSGHRFLIGEMRRVARERGLPAAVITFPVHPRVILQSDYQPKLLNSFGEKLEWLSESGTDYVIVMDFTPSLAALTAREFIVDVLSGQWRIGALVIGYDHRFGHLRSDGFEQYAVYGRECGMEVVRAVPYSEKGVTFSSSVIRQMLRKGDVAGAARILGYFYRLKGHVVSGCRVGRSIGFPTANMAVDEKFKVIPAAGSYAVWVSVGGRRFRGMLYIGSRPTVHRDGGVSIEVHIFDFSEDIYDESVTVEFVEFVREEMTFDSQDGLKAQLQLDRQQIDGILEKQASPGRRTAFRGC
ncbi:MAG: riboflavin biosynthesis protein RibF [Tannerella sp.]|jgi:riboflavin kinase/FMN adenylyltransferase|nr:riboflavin biosynthesis protein RibF [Tannerella sp.]